MDVDLVIIKIHIIVPDDKSIDISIFMKYRSLRDCWYVLLMTHEEKVIA